jgi:hypothetical protein
MKILTVLAFLLISVSAYSQEKYFEIVLAHDSYGLMVKPIDNKKEIILSYNGKTQKQLMVAVQKYIKERPRLKIDSENSNYVYYRDFATICTMEKCMADLVALTYINIAPENNGTLKVSLGLTSKIFSSIFGAKLNLNPDDIVVSDNDVPFNEYVFVQPADQKKSPIFKIIKEAKLAYPESIFDSKGKIINPINKTLIEKFYDGYVADLKNYLDKKL